MLVEGCSSSMYLCEGDMLKSHMQHSCYVCFLQWWAEGNESFHIIEIERDGSDTTNWMSTDIASIFSPFCFFQSANIMAHTLAWSCIGGDSSAD